MTTIIQYTRVCYYCESQVPASETRYVARYDLDVCHDCYLAYY